MHVARRGYEFDRSGRDRAALPSDFVLSRLIADLTRAKAFRVVSIQHNIVDQQRERGSAEGSHSRSDFVTSDGVGERPANRGRCRGGSNAAATADAKETAGAAVGAAGTTDTRREPADEAQRMAAA